MQIIVGSKNLKIQPISFKTLTSTFKLQKSFLVNTKIAWEHFLDYFSISTCNSIMPYNCIASDSREAVQWPGGEDNVKSTIIVLTEDSHSVSIFE